MKKLDLNKTLAYIRGLNRRSLKFRLVNKLPIPKPSTIQLLYRIDIFDPKGKLYKTTGDQPSHSFVKQFLQLMEILMAHPYDSYPDSVTIVDTGGSGRSYSASQSSYISHLMATEAGAGNTTYGILVGTGETAPATGDYSLETQISHGTGAGQLSYGATTVDHATEIGANMDMIITRAFVNGSGASITIKECGIVVRHMHWGSGYYYFLIIHDAANQAVPDGYTAYVTYTIRTTV